jgi:hypothetical protein
VTRGASTGDGVHRGRRARGTRSPGDGPSIVRGRPVCAALGPAMFGALVLAPRARGDGGCNAEIGCDGPPPFSIKPIRPYMGKASCSSPIPQGGIRTASSFSLRGGPNAGIHRRGFSLWPNFFVLMVHRVVPAKLATRKSDGFVLSGKRSHGLAARAHDTPSSRQ